MTQPDKDKKAEKAEERLETGTDQSKKDADWANGLKRLYDSVLEEPVPDNFKDLLSKLDDGEKK